jgi:hypothetical protein
MNESKQNLSANGSGLIPQEWLPKKAPKKFVLSRTKTKRLHPRVPTKTWLEYSNRMHTAKLAKFKMIHPGLHKRMVYTCAMLRVFDPRKLIFFYKKVSQICDRMWSRYMSYKDKWKKKHPQRVFKYLVREYGDPIETYRCYRLEKLTGKYFPSKFIIYKKLHFEQYLYCLHSAACVPRPHI